MKCLVEDHKHFCITFVKISESQQVDGDTDDDVTSSENYALPQSQTKMTQTEPPDTVEE